MDFSFGNLTIDLLTTRNAQLLAKFRLGSLETLCSTTSSSENLYQLSVFSLQVEDTMTIQPIFPTIMGSLNNHRTNHH